LSFAFLMTAFHFDRKLTEFLEKHNLISRKSKLMVYIKPLETVQLLLSLQGEVDRLRGIEEKHLSLEKDYERLLKTLRTAKEPAEAKPMEAFHFYSGMGRSTGLSASNLKDFHQKLKEAPMESIEFHSQRGDFEKWLRSSGYSELAEGFEGLRAKGESGENLRGKLIELLETQPRSGEPA